MREATHGSLRTDVFEKGEVLRVSCPCCKKRLFDLEMDSEVGNETIRIKCSRCIRLSEKIRRRCGCDKPGKLAAIRSNHLEDWLMRKATHMTQKELADALDIDYRVVSRYETGEAEMGVVLYQKMLAVFDISSLDEQPRADTADLLQLWSGLAPENRQQLMSLAAMMKKSQSIL